MEGWNDPMDLSKFEPSGKLKINLNKRVAYPLNKSETASSSQEPLRSLPTIPFGLSAAQNTSDESDNLDVQEFDSQTAKQKVLTTLEESIKDLSVQPNVKAKLKTLENEWDNCDMDLQKLLVQLIEYIEQKDAKNASAVQRKIILKGYNKPFMQGIRQIIFSLESKEAETNNVEA